MSEITARPSTALANRYTIERALGSGWMATVFATLFTALRRHGQRRLGDRNHGYADRQSTCLPPEGPTQRGPLS